MRRSASAKGQSLKTFLNGVWRDHPIFSMILGICSALAVSNKVENAIAMGAGVTFDLMLRMTDGAELDVSGMNRSEVLSALRSAAVMMNTPNGVNIAPKIER